MVGDNSQARDRPQGEHELEKTGAPAVYSRMRLTILGPVLALLISSCGSEGSDEECDDINNQIAEALALYKSRGVLVANATACGENGISNRRDGFDPRATDEAVLSLQEDFAGACEKLARC